MQVIVRDNNVDQALRVLKKKMQREGIFREMKQRRAYEKPSERRVREKAEAIRRVKKLARKKAQREGLLPMPKPKPRPELHFRRVAAPDAEPGPQTRSTNIHWVPGCGEPGESGRDHCANDCLSRLRCRCCFRRRFDPQAPADVSGQWLELVVDHEIDLEMEFRESRRRRLT